MPKITIDDKSITVPNGTLIVEAARQLAIEVPVFCYHSRLASVGMCRMCLVEVGTPRMGPDRKPVLKADGTPEIAWMPKPQTACTMTVSEGMVVRASAPSVQEARRGVVEFLLTSHPLDCPICDKGGECTLQEETMSYGPGRSRFVYNDKFFNEKRVPLGPLIMLDRERCVQCARCIRFQDEIADDRVLGFSERGRGMEIITFSNPPFDSKFSGNTTDICPVGALTTSDFRFRARPWEVEYVPSVCPHCAVGCNLTLSVRNHEDIRRVLPRTNPAVNDIWLCDKGRFGHHFATSPIRLTTPLICKNGNLTEASWSEAYELIAERIAAAKVKGPDAIAGRAGDSLANEDLYLFGKLFREVLRSDRVSSVAEADDLNATVGLAANSDITKLGKGTAVLVIGSDVEEEAPVAFLRIKKARESGVSLIVANGRPTKLDRYGTAMRYRYGSAGQLLAALIHVVVHEQKANSDFIAARVSGFEALADHVRDYTPEAVAERTGISTSGIRDAARAIAQAKDAVFVYGCELADPAARELLKTLVIITGHAGRPNNGVWPMLAHSNTQGARDILPPRAVAANPSVLYLVGVDAPRGDAEFIIVQDLFLTGAAKTADVVLPAQSLAERDGTLTNQERRVQHFAAAIRPRGDSKADWKILTELAGELDQHWAYQRAADVFAEIAEKVPAYKGISYARLMGQQRRSRPHFIYEGTSFETRGEPGLVWPAAAEDAGTKFELQFAAPAVSPAGGLQLIAPRLLYDAGTLITESELLGKVTASSYAELNRADAERLHVTDGQMIRLKSAIGAVELTARVDGRAPEGVVIAPVNLRPVDTRRLLADGEVAVPVTVERL